MSYEHSHASFNNCFLFPLTINNIRLFNKSQGAVTVSSQFVFLTLKAKRGYQIGCFGLQPHCLKVIMCNWFTNVNAAQVYISSHCSLLKRVALIYANFQGEAIETKCTNVSHGVQSPAIPELYFSKIPNLGQHNCSSSSVYWAMVSQGLCWNFHTFWQNTQQRSADRSWATDRDTQSPRSSLQISELREEPSGELCCVFFMFKPFILH